MGVEYKHYLIPSDNTYRPGPEDLSRLVHALHDAGFLGTSRLRPEEAAIIDLDIREPINRDVPFVAQLGMNRYKPFPCPCRVDDFIPLDGQEYRLAWTVDNSIDRGLVYPLEPNPDHEDGYYNLEFHVANDFIYGMSEEIDPFESELVCRCGQPLEFDNVKILDDPYLWGPRIRRMCPRCGTPFRPQDQIAEVRDGWTGEVGACRGGATYLFAVVVDCGKCFARQGGPMRATESFLEVVTKALRQPFYELGISTVTLSQTLIWSGGAGNTGSGRARRRSATPRYAATPR